MTAQTKDDKVTAAIVPVIRIEWNGKNAAMVISNSQGSIRVTLNNRQTALLSKIGISK